MLVSQVVADLRGYGKADVKAMLVARVHETGQPEVLRVDQTVRGAFILIHAPDRDKRTPQDGSTNIVEHRRESEKCIPQGRAVLRSADMVASEESAAS